MELTTGIQVVAGQFVPLADVPDFVWKTPQRKPLEAPNHFAELDRYMNWIRIKTNDRCKHFEIPHWFLTLKKWSRFGFFFFVFDMLKLIFFFFFDMPKLIFFFF
eukprot:Phypoly_transcript_12964.p1 GENE.Phypoly_transcript_12964~~Phypoly_transcript_12964.p1  ORF type:complete len:104 (-),score=0.72 Phypoly_transcript_12964:631-942(-)